MEVRPRKELVGRDPDNWDCRTSERIATPPSANPMKPLGLIATSIWVERPLATRIIADSLWVTARKVPLIQPQTSQCSIFLNLECWIKPRRRLQHRMRRWSKSKTQLPRVKGIWLEYLTARYLKIHSPVIIRVVLLQALWPLGRAWITCSDIKKTFKSMMPVFPQLKIWRSAGFTTCSQVFPSSTWMIWLRLEWGSTLAVTCHHFTGKICPRWPKPLTWMQFRKSGPLVTMLLFLITRSKWRRKCASAWSPLSSRSHAWRTTRKKLYTWRQAWLIDTWPCWPCSSKKVPVW